MILEPLDNAPIELEPLSQAIRRSSNFSFASSFYLYEDANPASARGALAVFDAILALPAFEHALRETWVADYRKTLEVSPREKHAVLVPAEGNLENVLAAAAHDHAGAYSSVLRDATRSERDTVASLFQSLGDYLAFELVPQRDPACPTCGHGSHLPSSWFYGVAWDWCFFVAWPGAKVAGVVCLTDTD